MFKIGSQHTTDSTSMPQTCETSQKLTHVFKDITPDYSKKLIDAINEKKCIVCAHRINNNDKIVHHCFTPGHAKCVAHTNFDKCFLNCGAKLVHSNKTAGELKNELRKYECENEQCYASPSDTEKPCPYPFETKITLKPNQFFLTEFKDRITQFLIDKFSAEGYTNIEVFYADKKCRRFAEARYREQEKVQRFIAKPFIYVFADHEKFRRATLCYNETDLIRGNQDRNTKNMMKNLISALRTDLMIATFRKLYPFFFNSQSELYIYRYIEPEDQLILKAAGSENHFILKLSSFWDTTNLKFSFDKLQQALSEQGLSFSKLAEKKTIRPRILYN